jgi:hypothetical protein
MAEDTLRIKIKADDVYSSELKRMRAKFSQASVAVAGTLVAVGTAMGALVAKTAAAGDQFHKMSIRTGVSVKTLSELSHVAAISGTNIETVSKGMTKLQKTANDANNGLSTATRGFDQIGVSVNDANGQLKDTESLFFEVIEGLRTVESRTKQAAIAQEIFGKSGAQMIPIINESAESIENLREEAHELGITFDQEAADNAAKFTDEMERLTKSAGALGKEMGLTLLPVLSDLADRYTKLFKFIQHVTAGEENQRKSMSQLNEEIDAQRQAISKLEQKSQSLSMLDGFKQQQIQREIADRQQVIAGLNQERIALNEVLKEKEAMAAQEEAEADRASDTISAGGFLAQQHLQYQQSRQLTDQYLAEEKEAKDVAYEAETEALVEKYNMELALQARQNSFMQEMRDEVEKQQEIKRRRDLAATRRNEQLKLQAMQQGASNAVALLSNLSQLAGEEHEGYFNMLKGARIAEAAINTFAGATRAYAEYPYPYSLIVSGLVIAAGLAQIAVIARQQFDGGGGVGGSSGGGTGGGGTPPTISPPEIAAPPATGDQPQREQQVTFVINNPIGDENWDNIMEEQVIPAWNRARDRNVNISTG